MEFYCFLLRLRSYLQGSERNPMDLRPFIHWIAVQLPPEEMMTDRRLLDALRVYPIDAWWPPAWGEIPLDPWLFIHDGKHLHPEAQTLLERLALQHNLNLDSLPCDALDGLLANDAFNTLRLQLAQEWTEAPDDREEIEEAYRQLRRIPAENPVIGVYELQRLAAGNRYLDLPDLRRTFYVPGNDFKHMTHADGNFVVCRRCGLRNPEDYTCIRGRCPGQEGWTSYPHTTDQLILHPEHMRRIMVPAQEELALFEQIKALVEPAGGHATLWPAVDRFDIYAVTPTARIAIDVKDWEYPEQLARSIAGDIPNYAPYPYDIGAYVYPTDRGVSYGDIVRERAGARLATNRVVSTKSILSIIRRTVK